MKNNNVIFKIFYVIIKTKFKIRNRNKKMKKSEFKWNFKSTEI